MAMLIVTNPGMDPIAQFPLDGRRKVTIGRSRQRDLILDDPGVSRLHCVLVRERDVWCIVDARSSGGTYVDDRRVLWKRMRPERIAAVGDFRLYISPVALPATTPGDAVGPAVESQWDLADGLDPGDTMAPASDASDPFEASTDHPAMVPMQPGDFATEEQKSAFLNGDTDFIPLESEPDDEGDWLTE